MKKPNNFVTNFYTCVDKARKYVQLQNQGVSKMEATYRVFGNKIGDEMVKLWQHEIILDQPNLN